MTRPPQNLLKIGDFAHLADTNQRTLRYYEELGILVPAERSAGGFRYYRPNDLQKVRLIHDLQALGLHLDTIRELLATRDETDRHAWIRKVESVLDEQRRLIDERIAKLEEQRGHAEAALEQIHSHCGTCTQRAGEENNFCEPCQMTGGPLPDSLGGLF